MQQLESAVHGEEQFILPVLLPKELVLLSFLMVFNLKTSTFVFSNTVRVFGNFFNRFVCGFLSLFIVQLVGASHQQAKKVDLEHAG